MKMEEKQKLRKQRFFYENDDNIIGRNSFPIPKQKGLAFDKVHKFDKTKVFKSRKKWNLPKKGVAIMKKVLYIKATKTIK